MSSWVAAGHVGLSAAAPVLQALGHEVIQLPTAILSNHKAWPAVAGRSTPPAELLEMLDAIAANGWLAGIDAVVVGYLPEAALTDAACRAIEEVETHSPATRVVVDPVLGDHPKGLYVPESAADAIRDRLLPLADDLTPNRFELGWLTGQTVETGPETEAAARALASLRADRRVFVTSPAISDNETGILEVTQDRAQLYRTPRHDRVPHGVGDVFSALIGAGLPCGTALGHLQAIIGDSLGAPHLAVTNRAAWIDAEPVPPEPV